MDYLVINRRLVALYDGDLFFYCLKAVVFGDLELARLVVDHKLDLFWGSGDGTEANPDDVINQILARIQRQFEFLIHDLDEEYIKNLELTVGSDKQWSWTALQANTSPTRVQENLEILDASFSFPADVNVSERAHDDVDLLLKNRRLLCLASFDVDVRINEHERCIVSSTESPTTDGIVYGGPALPNCAVGSDKGTMEIYLSETIGEAGTLICVVHRQEECVSCFSVGEGRSFDATSFAKARPSFRHARTHSGG